MSSSPVYPAPHLGLTFLGFHSVKSVKGVGYFGPTAVPAFGLEHYRGRAAVSLGNAASITYRLIDRYLGSRQNFRACLHAEAGRFLRYKFASAARNLVPRRSSLLLVPRDKVGVRSRSLDAYDHTLVMDFLVKSNDNAMIRG